MSAKTDWQNKDLRAAAVEYAIQQCGRRPASSPGEWQRAVSQCAASLDVPVLDLSEWMDAGELQPDVISGAEEMPDNVPESIPEILIDDEARALGERLRAIVEYVFPRESVEAVTWEIRDSTLALPCGSTWRHIAIAPLDGRASRARRTAVEVTTPKGRIVRLYAVGRQVGQSLKIYQLRPSCRTIDATGIIRRVAVIESVLHPERPNEGQALAELLDVSEPAIHYRRKAMADWIRERTGAKGGLPGMLNKDQSNKGRAKISHETAAD